MSTNKSSHVHHFAHHFKNAEHEYQSSKEGIWLFMVTEILMFGGLFVGYSIMHALYPTMFAEGASHLDWRLGSINTVVLILSSLTMALGIMYIQKGENKKAIVSLALTILCGFLFMGIKYFEYMHKIHLGFFPPGQLLEHTQQVGTAVAHSNLGLYFGFYFSMTGLHGLHVLVGMCLIAWVLMRTIRGDFSPNYYTAVEGVGIFWHIVDLIWIFLFPLLYLIG